MDVNEAGKHVIEAMNAAALEVGYSIDRDFKVVLLDLEAPEGLNACARHEFLGDKFRVGSDVKLVLTEEHEVNKAGDVMVIKKREAE